jgi:hypothetical protein
MLSDEQENRSEEKGVMAAPLALDTAEDFFDFTIDGVPISLDISEAHARLVALDVKFRDDPWTCLVCVRDFHPGSLADPKCPECGESQKIERLPRWLDELSDFIVSKGAKRCGRDKAGKLYMAILSHIERLKKNTS